MHLLSHYGIDLVFDVGANQGQYAQNLRAGGYHGHIVSFEPDPDVYARLTARARDDAHWQTINVALGASAGTAMLNLAGDSSTNSFYKPLPILLQRIHAAGTVRQIPVPLTTLDELYPQYQHLGTRPFLKLDTQGYEKQILLGAANVLDQFDGVQIELSLTPSYENEPLIDEMLPYLMQRGLTLMSFEPVFMNHDTGQIYQMDALFFRASTAPS